MPRLEPGLTDKKEQWESKEKNLKLPVLRGRETEAVVVSCMAVVFDYSTGLLCCMFRRVSTCSKS